MLTAVSVICTGLAFAALLEHKYNHWVTLLAMSGTAILALLMVPVFGAVFMPSTELPADVLANAAVNFVYLIASLFIFENHLLQKLSVTLLSALHLAMFPSLGAWMQGLAGQPVTGFGIAPVRQRRYIHHFVTVSNPENPRAVFVDMQQAHGADGFAGSDL